MKRQVILNLAGVAALSLLCSCGETAEQAQPEPQEQVEVVEGIEELVPVEIEMPEEVVEIPQEAFAEFPDDELQDDGDDDDDLSDRKA